VSERRLDDDDIASLFGTTVAKLRAAAGPQLDALNRGYAPIAGTARDQLLLGILTRIDSPALPEAGQHRAADWERGWQENLDDFVASGFSHRTLVPKYYKNNVPVRLSGDYVQPAQADFVYAFTDIFRAWLYREFLGDFNAVHEFGCGTGYNLVQLAGIYPEKSLVGYDWARPSQQLLTVVAEKVGLRVRGRHFDFFNPDPSIAFEPNSAVMTFGALEQAGANHGAYLEFLMARRPALCVDVIGIEELYDETDFSDYLALRYHRRRGYLSGYLTRLREFEAAGRIRILTTHHQRFGTLYDDPHSYVVWAPL
jgi:hypothetical protein